MKPADFTVPRYERLCRSLQDFNYRVCTILEYLESDSPADTKKVAILRHDVDRRALNALRVAQVEHNLGIRSTYYFRSTPSSFVPEIMRQIHEYGHEIGYHYETLALANGDFERAIELFRVTLDRFRRIAPVRTISMHGSPLSKWDNRDLWKKYDFTDFGILGEPYFSIDYENVLYLTDTGRTWQSDRFNLRDKVEGKTTRPRLRSTDDVVRFLRKNDRPVMIQSHPERWAHSAGDYTLGFIRDLCANSIKLALTWFR